MMAKNNTRRAGRTRRIMLALCALTCAAAAVLASCGKKEDGDSIGADTSSAECDSMNGINESDADSNRVYNAAAINRLTGLPLDDTSLHNHRPIAIMINNINVACPHELRHDEKNHINVYTTGSGDGLFISGGKYISIKWTKDGVDEPLHLFREDGSPLLLNCGTTFVNIMSPDTMAAMTIE